MKVSDLIQQLTHMNPEAEVHFSYNYGDYGRTEVAPQIRRVEEEYVIHSDYHRMDKIADEEYDTNEETGDWEEGVRSVVILR
jgi:hypothetical protein